MTTGKIVALKPKSSHKRAKITLAVVNRIAKRQKPYFIRDTELKGFAIQVNPVKDPVYRVEARLMGTGPNTNATIGSINAFTPTEARKIAGEYLRQIRAGNDPKIEKNLQKLGTETFEKLMDTFLDDRKAQHKERTQKDLSLIHI